MPSTPTSRVMTYTPDHPCLQFFRQRAQQANYALGYREVLLRHYVEAREIGYGPRGAYRYAHRIMRQEFQHATSIIKRDLYSVPRSLGRTMLDLAREYEHQAQVLIAAALHYERRGQSWLADRYRRRALGWAADARQTWRLIDLHNARALGRDEPPF